ncbi:DoxX family protein [Corynebacterium sp. HMSC06D04]|uniref:DoxX family protein n=1 Tax=Corynebacterium TaxID=1716 RepID=UPI0007837C9D|nr:MULTISPECIES: DoxX family protein [Corynebacterium]AMO90308.1 doxX family protein [Corynebacterium simulans]OFT44388.1 DoxX family protein [Corynebacterium sp. HMSC06G04]OFT50212.1 DoxX family protein [Corynebacterium sp. HMSC06D04]OHO65201.1 DoxX family protein [Corynebacterium sp. HMSC036D03]
MIRKFARPMLASVFVWDGVDTLRNASDHVAETESVLQRLRKVVPAQYAGYIPNDPELAARAVGGLKVGAGSTLALGKAPRTSAAVLALSTLPNLLGRNAFWEAEDSEEKNNRRNGFITNTALLGALFIATQDTEGKPSLAWRASKSAERTNKKIQKALPTKSEQQKFADNLSDRADEFSTKASDWFEGAKEYVDDNKDDWQATGKDLVDSARSFIEDSAEQAKSFIDDNKDDWLSTAQENAELARKKAVKAASKAQERADFARAQVDTKANKRAAKKASKRAEKLQKEASKKLDKAINKFGDRLN